MSASCCKNLKFTLPMENEVMGGILDDGKEPEAAAKDWLKANPGALDGLARRRHRPSTAGDGLAAVKSEHLGL